MPPLYCGKCDDDFVDGDLAWFQQTVRMAFFVSEICFAIILGV